MQKAANKHSFSQQNQLQKLLLDKKKEDEYAYQFKPPASNAQLSDFEQKFEVQLPELYKAFLRIHNGGFICSGSWAEYIWETGNTDLPRDRSLVLLSIEEISIIYSGFVDSINEYLGGYFYPFDMIPFAEAENFEYLVFKNIEGDEKDSPVFDGEPGIGIGSRGKLFDSFNDFLCAYIENDGFVLTCKQMAKHKSEKYKRKLFESLSTNRYDKINTLDKPEEIIKTTTEQLNISDPDFILLGLRAEAHLKLENYKSCILDCNKALRSEKDYLWILALRWYAYYLAGHEKQAETEKERVLELENNNCY